MKRYLAASLFLLACAIAPAQQPPLPTEILGEPFLVKSTWILPGNESWDFVKLDPAAGQLFVARGEHVQVVDLETGAVVASINGVRDAHAIALDNHQEFGFISAGAANEVDVFDRRSFKIVARIPTGPNPRALVYEPTTGLLFAICGQPRLDKNSTNGHSTGYSIMPGPASSSDDWNKSVANSNYEPGSFVELEPENPVKPVSKRGLTLKSTPPKEKRFSSGETVESVITVIDTETWTPEANIAIRGRAGAAETDAQGHIFVTLLDQPAIIRLDSQALQNLLDELLAERQPPLKYGKNIFTAVPETPPGPPPSSDPANLAAIAQYAVDLNWLQLAPESVPPSDIFKKVGGCTSPKGLSIDGRHLRLFLACGEAQMGVFNADNGQLIQGIRTGAGTSVIEFDPNHGLVFAANGDGGGSLTIIRQHVVDKYEVVQNLPTAPHARVLAVNPITGEVYIVTDSVKSGLAVLVVGH
jgi:DNA-binding beta-propeller fold protein YncE